MMMNYICLLYYYLPEKFIKCGPCIQIVSSDSNVINKADVVETNIYAGVWNNAHGNVIINPEKNPNAVAVWTMKIECGASDSCIVGIRTTHNMRFEGFDGDCTRYAWCGDGIRLKITQNGLNQVIDTQKVI